MNPSTDYFESALQRMYSSTNTRTQVELAAVLGIRQSSISDAKRRGSIPADWQITLFNQYSLNPAWICTGQGPQFLMGCDGEVAVSCVGEKTQETAPRMFVWERTHTQAAKALCPKLNTLCRGALCMAWLSTEVEDTENPKGVCGLLHKDLR